MTDYYAIFQDYLAVLYRHKKIVVLVFLGVFLLTCVKAILTPKNYRVKSTFFVYSDNVAGTPTTLSSAFEETLPTQDYGVAILKSHFLLEDVVEKLKFSQDAPGSVKFERKVKQLQQKIQIEPGTNRVISVYVDDNNPDTAIQINNTCVESLYQFILNMDNLKVNFIKDQMLKTLKLLEAAESNLADFESKTKLVGLDDKTREVIRLQSDLEKEYVLGKVKLVENQKMLELSGSLPELSKLESESYAGNAQVKALEESIQKVDHELTSLPVSMLGYLRLSREAKAYEAQYKVLSEQYRAFQTRADNEIVPYRILDRPFVEKVTPSLLKSLFVGGFLSFVLACLAAFLWEGMGNDGEDPGEPPHPVRTTPGEGNDPDSPTDISTRRGPQFRGSWSGGRIEALRTVVLKALRLHSFVMASSAPMVEEQYLEEGNLALVAEPVENPSTVCKRCENPNSHTSDYCESCNRKLNTLIEFHRKVNESKVNESHEVESPQPKSSSSLVCVCGKSFEPTEKQCTICGKSAVEVVRELIRHRVSAPKAEQPPSLTRQEIRELIRRRISGDVMPPPEGEI